MTKRDLKLRLELLKKQLELINLYESNFINHIGKHQTLQIVDDILDEMIQIRKKIKSKSDD